MTHEELVVRAVRWLRSKHTIVFSEMTTSGEVPDAIGWRYGCTSTLIECKISRSDFAADREKYHRRVCKEGMGQARYYMVPEGLIKPEDIISPCEGWGLLEVGNKQVKITKESASFYDRNWRSEMRLLTSALRRAEIRAGSKMNDWLRWEGDGAIRKPEEVRARNRAAAERYREMRRQDEESAARVAAENRAWLLEQAPKRTEEQI